MIRRSEDLGSVRGPSGVRGPRKFVACEVCKDLECARPLGDGFPGRSVCTRQKLPREEKGSVALATKHLYTFNFEPKDKDEMAHQQLQSAKAHAQGSF
eukprot:CAMPEP_0172587372 /NCGR_PEP_ID=MMETSP1068-20121228/6439_1 /TAXON_ID=35684 /ORGANISM="Pseudopedinella elastica, Strain CCMP716" /LENGTH=97 /DNA_ID=CAMNT_0013382379 /DNA_START=130 /DNA_END=423 /DNA_ORIENTATION=-